MSSPSSKQGPLAGDTSPGTSPPRTGSPLMTGSPPRKQSPLAGDTSPGTSPPRTGSPLIAGSPPRKQSPLVSSSSPGTSPTGKQSPLVVGSSPGAKSPLKSPDGAKAKRETQLAKLQRQASKDSAGGSRFKRVGSDGSFRGRTDSSTSGLRRPSLGFGHSNNIPFHLEAPSHEEIDLVKVPWWTSQRLMLSAICFVGFFCLYSLRVNLSTAIVCMTKEIVDDAGNTTNTNVAYTTGNNTGSNGTNVQISLADSQQGQQGVDADGCSLVTGGRKLEGDFVWNKSLQGLILGAFFWGYTAMQIPSGILSDRFGARLTISCGMFPVAILTILSPFLAKGSPYLLLVGRALIGVGEAMMYPGMQSLWAKWSPPHERSRLVGFAFGGSQLGNALTFPFAGLLCAYGFDGGWPSVFYVTGMMTFVWCCVYVFFARNSPGENPRISAIERKYVEQSLGTYGQSVEEMLEERKHDKPWKRILTSGPVWAILIANACGNYGAYMLLTQMPTYMKEVLKFDIKSNGAFSMIPYLVFWLFIIGGGQIADIIITREILTVEKTRKVCCCAGMVIPAIFLVATGYMDCKHQIEAVVLLSLSMGFCGFQFSSFFINHGDIAPKYAGTVFGFTNMGASVPGILAPYIVGALTQNKTKEEWRLAFYIAAGVYVFGAVVYWILAKGEVLEWAKEEIEYDKREVFPLHEITEEHEHEEDTDAMLNGDKPKVNFE